jgi:hypothetical protein
MKMSYKNIFLYGTAKKGFVACAAFVLSVAFWATATPVIRDIGLDANKNKGQVNGWIAIEGENFDGTTTSVLFAKSGGGTVASPNVYVSKGRGLILCQVPATAVTGNMFVVVDSVSSAGYPLNVNTTTFSPGSNTITGQVTSSGTGVPDVGVALLAEGNCGHGVGFYYCAKTDSSGHYTLYWPGSGTNFMIILLPPLSANLAGTGTLVSGAGNLTQDFALTAGTTVTGTVHNPSGGALPNAYVSFEDNGHDQILTDASGNFSIHLAPGDWTMYVEPPVGYHAMSLDPNGVPVTVPSSSPYSVGTKTLLGGVWFSGTLKDDSTTPQPVVAADLSINPQNGGSTYNENLSRPDGTFGIMVRSGEAFQLNIKTARTGPLVDWQQGYGPYSSDTNIGTITLGHAGFVTGTVKDENAAPLSDVGMATIHATSGSWLSNTNTCSDGSYILKVPSAGTTIPVHVTTAFWNDPRPLATQVYNDKIFLCEGDVVDVSNTSTVSGINFTLHPGGSVSGQVTYYPGTTPVPNVNVQVDDGNSHNCALGGWPPTDSSGNYQFDHLPIMSSRFWVGNQPGGYSKGSYLNKIYPDYTPVTPVADNLTSGINIPLWTAQSPRPVPNGTGGTQAGKVTKLNSDASQITATWDVTTCRPPGNANYSALVGVGSGLASYQLVGSLCNIGISGTYTGYMPPVPSGERFLWWVLVETGGSGQTESSWGKNSAGQERNGSNASSQCQNIYKDTSQTCP